MAAVFPIKSPTHYAIDMLAEGAVVKYKLLAKPPGSSAWIIHHKGSKERISREWFGEMIDIGYVVFSKEAGGYIATDKLKEAV